jgi:hypothetical protein
MDMKNETGKLFDDGLVTAEPAYELLYPHYGRITACVAAGLEAWKELQEKSPEKCLPLTSCTVAGIIQNHMVQHARMVFSGMEPDVVMIGDSGFLIVDLFGRLKMRFKKLSERLHPYNVATYRQRACDNQTLFERGATLVTTGYRVTPLGVFKDAHIVCWSGSELRWSLPLPDVEGAAGVHAVSTGGGPSAPVLVPKRSTEVATRRAT